MTASDWRGVINQILYGLIFTREITDEIVEWNADQAIDDRSFDRGPAAFYEAIRTALASGESLDGLNQVPQFSQEEIADLLQDLLSRLDSRKPWPEPPFRVFDARPWRRFPKAVTIAKLDVPLIDLSNVFRRPFEPATCGDEGKYGLTFLLQTGETVALLGSYARDARAAMLSQGAEDPGTVIAHFVEATGIPPNKIVRV